MVTEFQAIDGAWEKSKRVLDEVVIVYLKDNGDYGFCLESEYTGDEDNILERYLNGSLVPA